MSNKSYSSTRNHEKRDPFLDPDAVFGECDEGSDECAPYECSDGDCQLLSCCGEHSYSLNVWRGRFGKYVNSDEIFSDEEIECV